MASPIPGRPPITFTATARAEKFANGIDGAQVINTSTTATMWLGSRSDLRPGAGTPVPPNTAIVWQFPGDLFVILGTDTDSVAAGSANGIISFDVTGWQPNPAVTASIAATAILNAGVLIVDNPSTLINNVAAVAPYTSATFDVRRFNSLILRMSPSGGVFPGSLNVEFVDAPVAGLTISTIQLTTSNLTTVATTHVIKVVGPYVRISGFSANFIITLIASYRQTERRIRSETSLPYLFAGNVVIPPGNQSFYLPAWFGNVRLVGRCYQAGAVLVIGSMDVYTGAGTPYTIPLNSTGYQGRVSFIQAFGSSIFGFNESVALYGGSSFVTVLNTTAANINAEVVCVPEAT